MHSASLSFFALGALLSIPALAAPHLAARDGEVPSLPSDPNTPPGCTWWHDNEDGSIPCSQIPAFYGNPSVTSSCENFLKGKAYCVEGPPAPAAPPSGPSSTTASAPTPTKTGNGVTTPTPTQPGMVDNCKAFYLVSKGEACGSVIRKNNIKLSQLVAWNPSVNPDCSGMWADVHVCAATLDGGADSSPGQTTPGQQPTPPSQGNGVQTPSPVQDGMTARCKTFHFVRQGESYWGISNQYGISVEDFVRWNPAARSDCSGLWADTYACVALL
ncbi:hypothetical protein RB601_006533 [Gaeumannomyces tritici]